LIYRKELKSASDATTPVPQTSRHFPLASFSAAMLVGWFVLYGGSSSRGPNMVGFVLALGLFFTLVYRALDKTSPIDEQDTAFFSNAALMGLQIITNAFKKATEERPKTKLAVATSLRTTGFMARGFRYLSVCIHGRKGRERIAMIMLLEYIVFLVLVAVSAVLFWALAIKAAVPSEQALPLTSALRISASHFLPGIQDRSSTLLPWWAEFGPALTSWVLFVVYIGPVGSALPVRQEAFLKRLIPAQRTLLLIGRLWRFYRTLLKTLEQDLS
jgi:hypothetical protein